MHRATWWSTMRIISDLISEFPTTYYRSRKASTLRYFILRNKGRTSRVLLKSMSQTKVMIQKGNNGCAKSDHICAVCIVQGHLQWMENCLKQRHNWLKVDNAWLKGNLTTVWSVPRLDKDKDKNQDKDKGKDKYKDKECRGVIWPLCEVGPGRTKHLSGSKVAAKPKWQQSKAKHAWIKTLCLKNNTKIGFCCKRDKLESVLNKQF